MTTRKPRGARKPQGRSKKDTRKLVGRFGLDFAAVRGALSASMEADAVSMPFDALESVSNPALLRLRALLAQAEGVAVAMAPVDAAQANWTPMGPLAVPNGQTYGGARVLISGRVTAIAPHPTDGNAIYIGTSRGGVWKTADGGVTWSALGDHQPSLAIGALAISASDPTILYAGTGEGNVQLYSTDFPLSSAPGVYLGIGVLRTTNGGTTWTHHAAALFANHSFYRIAVDPSSADRAFAATSRGLCRTTDGVNWTPLTGGGLPAIASPVIACTDVIVDRGDATGNTVYAAFYQSGIYKTVNALAASPTFTQLTAGLPAGGSTGRISLHQSHSSPAHKYALVADNADGFEGLYRTTGAAGTTWELCTNSGTIQLYGAFTNDVAVDPTTPDVVYVAGVELYKCQRNAATGAWSVANIGSNIHPDSHAIGIHPTDNQILYSGNDGGFYVSRNGGTTWDDAPNEGLCLMQYEAIDHHGSSDAVVQGGTQDNGTQQYRNSPVHHHSADGDGGYCTISKVNGNHVTHAYYGNSPHRSVTGGDFGSYAAVSGGLNGAGLFYPPAAISPTSERLAWGTTVVNIDDAMGTGGWPGTGAALPGIVGRVSALSFTTNTLAYCATSSGEVYRLDLVGGSWSARALQAAPLPTGTWIWDVHSLPGSDDTVIVAFSGFGLAQHVWRGTVPASGAATWVAASGGLPDVPIYALAFRSATVWYAGTDIGVYRTTDAGTTWSNFSQGLPNTAIYDLRLRPGSHLLRAATHGRGLWEIRTDLASQPTVDIFVRDHIMDDGRTPSVAPVPAAWADATRSIALNDTCWWWHCADVKTDAPPAWQLSPSDVNYLNFETRLTHENPEKGNQNRVYVQVHNRGPLPATNVTVKIMTAGASAGLPDLPADFWTAWPNSTGDANWTAVGTPQTIAALEPLRPTVLHWDWTPAATADAHSCLLVVIDSPSDPVPASTKGILDIGQLVTTEKRVGLKNLHLVNLLPAAIRPLPFYAYGPRARRGPYLLRIPGLASAHLRISLLLPQGLGRRIKEGPPPKGLKVTKLAASDLAKIKAHWLTAEMRGEASWERFLRTFDVQHQFSVDAGSKGVDLPIDVKAGAREELMILLRSGDLSQAPSGSLASFTLHQSTTEGQILGGSTFVFKRSPQ